MVTSPAEPSPCACCAPSSCAVGRSSSVESPSIRVPCSDFISSSAVALDPGRTVAELRELRELTGDEEGAQRVAWTDTWVDAQEWMASKLESTGAEMEFDEARNQWWTLRGGSEKELLI